MSVISIIKMLGLLDIYCTLSMLHIIYIPYFSDIHTRMLSDPSDQIIRQIAYLNLMNGTIRLSFNHHKCNALVAFTYVLEAFILCIENSENGIYNIDEWKSFTIFVIALTLAYISYNAK